MDKHLLTYALKNGTSVFVDDVPKGLECGCICPCCYEPLVAKNAGAKRIHHFAHASGVECEGAYESMLHLLAKDKICKAFLESSVFNIQFSYRSCCPKLDQCKYIHYSSCYIESTRTFNLKDFYDSCEQEKPYDKVNRRSDIKLFSSNKNIPPVYIEIFVTHASDEMKLHSGEKIIEIKLESEEDIEKIVKYGFVEDIKPKDVYIEDFKPKTTFWGFVNKDYKANVCSEIQFVRYVLYSSGKSQCYQDVAPCNCIQRAQRNALYEVCFNSMTSLGIYEMCKYHSF